MLLRGRPLEMKLDCRPLNLSDSSRILKFQWTYCLSADEKRRSNTQLAEFYGKNDVLVKTNMQKRYSTVS